eukprot:3392304-Rhodomonas_salina.1
MRYPVLTSHRLLRPSYGIGGTDAAYAPTRHHQVCVFGGPSGMSLRAARYWHSVGSYEPWYWHAVGRGYVLRRAFYSRRVWCYSSRCTESACGATARVVLRACMVLRGVCTERAYG